MKYLVSLVIVLSASAVFAQVERKSVGNTSYEAVKARVEQSAFNKKMTEFRGKEFKAMESSPELMTMARNSVKAMVKDVPSVADMSTQAALIRVVNLMPKEAMAEIGFLTAVMRDVKASTAEKATAETNLKLLAAGSLTLHSLVEPGKVAAEKANAQSVIEIANKVSSLDFGKSTKDFVEKFQQVIEEAISKSKDISVDEAVRIASNDKFTKEDLIKCE